MRISVKSGTSEDEPGAFALFSISNPTGESRFGTNQDQDHHVLLRCLPMCGGWPVRPSRSGCKGLRRSPDTALGTEGGRSVRGVRPLLHRATQTQEGAWGSWNLEEAVDSRCLTRVDLTNCTGHTPPTDGSPVGRF